MNDNFELKSCSTNDALEFSSGTYRIQKILDGISSVFKSILGTNLCSELTKRQINITPKNKLKHDYANWFTNGIDCEILRVGGKSWEKGLLKINISIEFIPDEVAKPESPLDNVRQEINQN